MESLFYLPNWYCLSLGSYSWTSLGRGKKNEVASDFYQFLYLSLGLSIVLFALVFLAAPLILNNMGLEAAVADIAIRYLWFFSNGIIPLFTFLV